MIEKSLLGLTLLWLAATVAPPAVAAQAGRPLLIGFSQDTLANDWRVAQVDALKRAFARYPNVRFVATDGRGDTARQICDIEDLAHRHVDVLLVSPRDALAMAPVISRVYRSGIPVVLLTRRAATADYTTLIGPDDAAIARRAARYMARQMHDRGNIVVLQGLPAAATTQLRTQAFAEEIGHYRGIRITATRVGNYLRGDAIRATEELLRQHLPFDAIFAQSDSMAAGARIALRKAGRDPHATLIVGIDYIQEARSAILDGEQSASFTYPTCATTAARVTMAIAHGKRVPKRVLVESILVTRENAGRIKPFF